MYGLYALLLLLYIILCTCLCLLFSSFFLFFRLFIVFVWIKTPFFYIHFYLIIVCILIVVEAGETWDWLPKFHQIMITTDDNSENANYANLVNNPDHRLSQV